MPTAPADPHGQEPAARPAMIAVAPRHLAGRPRESNLTAVLVREHRWSRRQGEGAGERLVSPCGRLQLDLTDDVDDGWGRPTPGAQGWVLSGAQHRGAALGWSLSFSHGTPPELIGAAIATAIEIAAEHGPRAKTPFQPGNMMTALFPLVRAGWEDFTTPSGSVAIRSPDHWMRVIATTPSTLHDLRGLPAFKATCYHARRHWTARATAATPAQVLTAFTRSLTDPSPLLREREHLNLRDSKSARLTISPVDPAAYATNEPRRPAATVCSTALAPSAAQQPAAARGRPSLPLAADTHRPLPAPLATTPLPVPTHRR